MLLCWVAYCLGRFAGCCLGLVVCVLGAYSMYLFCGFALCVMIVPDSLGVVFCYCVLVAVNRLLWLLSGLF